MNGDGGRPDVATSVARLRLRPPRARVPWPAADSAAGVGITNGSTMNPAPCAEAMRNDHTVRSRKPTCMPPKRGCR